MFSDFTDDSVSILSILKLTGYDWSPMPMISCIQPHGVNLYIRCLYLWPKENLNLFLIYMSSF